MKEIEKGKTSIGSWLQLPDVFTAEIMAKAGFDWLAIDMEHGLIDIESVYKLIQVIGMAGVLPLVRLNENDPSTIRRVMDAGAGGIIVPMVNSAGDVQVAVNALKYPPMGKRSYGLGRAHEYGNKFEQYVNNINSHSKLIVQIEHIDALKNIDEIVKIEGIDAILIGPYDLSGSMGIPGNFSDDKYQKTIDVIMQKVKRSGIVLGIHIVHPSEEELRNRIAQGFNFIGYGVDTIFLSQGSALAAQSARKLIRKK